MFVRKNLTSEVGEEGKVSADMVDGQIVGVGKDISRKTLRAQFRLELNHRLDRKENVAEETAKNFEAVGETGMGANLLVKLGFGHEAGLVTEEQGRLGDEPVDFFGGD